MITFFSKEHRHPQKVSRRNVKGFGLFSSSARFDPENQFLGNIYSFNDYHCEPGYGIPMHPHEFFEVVCLQISGSMHFRDNLGNDKLTTRGSIHRFSSSTGYLHALYFHLAASLSPSSKAVLSTAFFRRADVSFESAAETSCQRQDAEGALCTLGCPR